MRDTPQRVAELVMERFLTSTSPLRPLLLLLDNTVLDIMQEQIQQELEYQEEQSNYKEKR